VPTATMLTDQRLRVGLYRMRRAYDALLSIREQVTPAEVALSDQWSADLEPVLRDLYWWPLRNGIDQAPEDEDELREFLERAFTDAAIVAALLALLLRYQERSVNLGGNMGLSMLDLPGTFRLTDADYLMLLNDHATMLTTPRTEMSLIDTTINHLVAGVPKARRGDGSTSVLLGGMIGAWVALRSPLIAITEETRFVGNGLNWTFVQNEVRFQDFITREGACKLCSPLHGRRMPVNNIPADLRLPVHQKCRCYYVAVTAGWTPPATIWTGGTP
jgi:hypothetical protein